MEHKANTLRRSCSDAGPLFVAQRRGETMCKHRWVGVNNVSVCKRCGLTLDRKTGKFIMFDRDFANAGSKKRRKHR